MKRVIFVVGLAARMLGQEEETLPFEEKTLPFKEAMAADLPNFRGQEELRLVGSDPWSPLANWSSPAPDAKSLGGSVSIAALRHKVPKAAKQAYERGAKSI